MYRRAVEVYLITFNNKKNPDQTGFFSLEDINKSNLQLKCERNLTTILNKKFENINMSYFHCSCFNTEYFIELNDKCTSL